MWEDQLFSFGGRVGLFAPAGSAPCCASFDIRPATPAEAGRPIAKGSTPPNQGGLFARLVLPSTDAEALEFKFQAMDDAGLPKPDDVWRLRLTTSAEGCRLLDPSGKKSWVAFPTAKSPQPLWLSWDDANGLRLWFGNDELLWLPSFTRALTGVPEEICKHSELPPGVVGAQWVGDAPLRGELFSDPMQWVMSSGWQTETPDRWSLSDGVLYGDASSGPISLSVGDESWTDYRVTLQLRCPEVPATIELVQGVGAEARRTVLLSWDGFSWSCSATAQTLWQGQWSSQQSSPVPFDAGVAGTILALSVLSAEGCFGVRLGGKDVHAFTLQPVEVTGGFTLSLKSGVLGLSAVSVQSSAWQEVARLSKGELAKVGDSTTTLFPRSQQSEGVGTGAGGRLNKAWPAQSPLMTRLRGSSQILHRSRLVSIKTLDASNRVLRGRDGSSWLLVENLPGVWQGLTPRLTLIQTRTGETLADGGQLPPMPLSGSLAAESTSVSGIY